MPIENSPYLFEFRPTTAGKKFSDINLQHPGMGRGNVLAGFLKPDTAAPDLFNRQEFHPQNPELAKRSIIDVVNKFEWTHTLPEGRHEVPFIRMSEYRVNFNSLLQNIRYLLTAIQPNSVGNMLNNTGISKLPVVPDVIHGGSKLLNKFRDVIHDTTGLGPIGNRQESNVANYLNQYYGLYGATPTGFEYYMPYFEGDFKTVSTSWNDWSQGGGYLSNVYSKLFSREGFLRTLVSGSLISPNAIGAYVERPKQYIYPDSGPSFKFTIDLINTQNLTDVVRNWHLVFMLLYQNLPNKTSKVLMEPPVIYEVEIPGTYYSPYAYISDLKVINVGATRLMKIPIIDKDSKRDKKALNALAYEQEQSGFDVKLAPGNNGHRKPRNHSMGNDTYNRLMKSNSIEVRDVPVPIASIDGKDEHYIETLIPDAFTVEITLQSLVPDSKNLFYHSTLGHKTLTTGIHRESYEDKSLLGVNTSDRQFIDKMTSSLEDKTLDHWIVELKNGEKVKIQPEDLKTIIDQFPGRELISARNAAGKVIPNYAVNYIKENY